MVMVGGEWFGRWLCVWDGMLLRGVWDMVAR